MVELNTTDAIVLAGGRGTRLSSVVSDRPKVLAEVLGRPVLTFLLDRLERAGIRRTILAVGYMADMVEDAIGSRHNSMEILYSKEVQPLGTGGGLQLASSLLQSSHALVFNGDSFCQLDLAGMVDVHNRQSAMGTIAVIGVPDAGRYGRVQTGPDQRIIKFEEKQAGGSGSINAGIYLVPSSALRTIPAGQPISLEREIFPVWVEQGLFAFEAEGPFLDIGLPETYAQASHFFEELEATR
jgi:D-glycero-alpha-D-manno-heptose 1-phosphate guanylyltransferase